MDSGSTNSIGSSGGLRVLIEAVEYARKCRTTKFSNRRLHTAQENLLEFIHDFEREIRHAQAGFRINFKDLGTTEELREELEEMKESVEMNKSILEEVAGEFEGARENLRRCMDVLYSTDELSHILRHSSNLNLSPVFWLKFKQRRREANELQDNTLRFAKFLPSSRTMHVQLHVAIAITRKHIAVVEGNEGASLKGLKASLLALDGLMHACQRNTQRFCAFDSQLTECHRLQCSAEVALLLERVEPILEGARLLEKDKFRLSVLDEVQPGIPLTYPDPPMKLTKDKATELDLQRTHAVQRVQKCKDLLDYADVNYTRDIYPYLIAHTKRTKLDFHRRHLRFKRQIERALREVERKELEVQHEGRKYDKWPRYYDFLRDKYDDKHETPRSAEQLAAKAKQIKDSWDQRLWAWMEQWVEAQARLTKLTAMSLSKDQSTVDEADRSFRNSIDIDRVTDVTLDEEDQEMRAKLLVKYKTEQEAMREALTGMSDSSEESARCCC